MDGGDCRPASDTDSEPGGAKPEHGGDQERLRDPVLNFGLRRSTMPASDLAAACGADEYCRQAMAGEQRPDAVVDLLGRDGTGPLWGMASNDLNATLLVWPAGRELAEDTNTDLDVLLVVVEGGGVAIVEQQEHVLAPGRLLLIEKGRSRAIRAGQDGLRYLSIHRRRGPLQIARPSGSG